MRARVIRDLVQNAIDFLQDSELALYTNPVAFTEASVGWHPLAPPERFLVDRRFGSVQQYLAWLQAGSYSAVLRDASLLQLTYLLDDDQVVGHRLAYIPCPVEADTNLLTEGESLVDVVALHLGEGVDALNLRSPMRFDFDPSAARVGHPAAHFSINEPECRIACVAPVHPYGFLDFVFRHFYPTLYGAQNAWFKTAQRSRLGARVISDEERRVVHLNWAMDEVA